MEGQARISPDVLARYAADAAREVPGISGLVEDHLHRQRAVRVTESDGSLAIELHVAVDWGASIPRLGRELQQRVADYLSRMADARPATVDVVVDEIGPSS